MGPQWTSKPHGYWSLFRVFHCSCPVLSFLSQTMSLIFISIVKVKTKTPTTQHLPPPKEKEKKKTKTAICFKDSRRGPFCLVVDPAGCGCSESKLFSLICRKEKALQLPGTEQPPWWVGSRGSVPLSSSVALWAGENRFSVVWLFLMSILVQPTFSFCPFQPAQSYSRHLFEIKYQWTLSSVKVFFTGSLEEPKVSFLSGLLCLGELPIYWMRNAYSMGILLEF